MTTRGGPTARAAIATMEHNGVRSERWVPTPHERFRVPTVGCFWASDHVWNNALAFGETASDHVWNARRRSGKRTASDHVWNAASAFGETASEAFGTRRRRSRNRPPRRLERGVGVLGDDVFRTQRVRCSTRVRRTPAAAAAVSERVRRTSLPRGTVTYRKRSGGDANEQRQVRVRELGLLLADARRRRPHPVAADAAARDPAPRRGGVGGWWWGWSRWRHRHR